MCHVLELNVPGFGRLILLCWDKMPLPRGMAAYERDGYGAFRQPNFESGYCDDWTFDCLLTSMTAVQAEDVRVYFLFFW